MTYEQVKNLKPGDFKRLCGVQPETFKGDAGSNATHGKTEKESRQTNQAEHRRPTAADFGEKSKNTAPTSTSIG